MRLLGGLLIAAILLGGGQEAHVDPPADLPRASRHLTWTQALRSTAARVNNLDNRPPDVATYRRLSHTLRNLYDPLADLWGTAVRLNSGYRSPSVNRHVGGYVHSDHMSGTGIDVEILGLSARDAARRILNTQIPFDTLIWYGADNHIHLSWSGTGSGRRRVQYATQHGARPVDRMP